MPRTIAAFDPVSRVRGLLVEVHAGLSGPVPGGVLAAFERRLYERSVRIGLLVTPELTWVVRDLVTGVHFRDTSFAHECVPTPLLLATVGAPAPARDDDGLARQVLQWLEAVAASWHSFVPVDATGALVPEVVGELAQLSASDFELWDDLLAPHDAVA